MKKCDSHTHPNLLKKPHQGDEFVKEAINRGFDTIIFTDHMPFTVTGDEHDRIPFGKVADYCDAVREISKKYKDEIKVLTGIEIDYRDSSLDEIKEVLSCGRFDRVLGSSHLNIKGFGIPFGKMSRSDFALLVLENYIGAAESGLFDVMTHLDVYRWVFSENDNYPLDGDFPEITKTEPYLRRLFAVMEKKGIALEFNAAPFFKKFDSLGAYPSWDILKIAANYNLNYTYGSDAHSACHVGFAYDEFERFRSNLI